MVFWVSQASLRPIWRAALEIETVNRLAFEDVPYGFADSPIWLELQSQRLQGKFSVGFCYSVGKSPRR